jgi:plasmid segregation protein ParM
MQQMIRAIDAGYGNIKYVVARSAQDITCRMFPSLAPVASHLKLTTGMSMARDTVIIEVDGTPYEVGPEAGLVLGRHHARVLHGEYVDTPQYLALMRGALSYMRVGEVDLLVVGLPVSLMNSKAHVLAKRLQGQHLVNGREVTVQHVWTIAQPLGGFVDYAMGQGIYQRLADQINLVVDVGYYTVDWLTGLGLQCMPERTGSFPGGVHSILNAVARSVSEELGEAYTDCDAIDRSLKSGMGALSIGTHALDLTRHWRLAQVSVDEAVTAIANSVGNVQDVRNIILVGGGAKHYQAAIRKRFPRPILTMAPNPIFSNVRGFQRLGEHYIGAES